MERRFPKNFILCLQGTPNGAPVPPVCFDDLETALEVSPIRTKLNQDKTVSKARNVPRRTVGSVIGGRFGTTRALLKTARYCNREPSGHT